MEARRIIWAQSGSRLNVANRCERAFRPPLCSSRVALAIEGIQSGALLVPTGLSAGQAYTEMAHLLLHGLTAGAGTQPPTTSTSR